MRYKLLFLALAVFALMGKAYAGVDPSSASWVMYKAYLYTDGACSTGKVTILDESGGVTSDFTTNPTIGSTTTVADGTYECVALKISDTVTFQPSASEGSVCVGGTSYSTDVCQASITSTDADGGADVTCTTGTDDTVWIYVSTLSTAATNSQTANSFTPPTTSNTNNGISLGSALEVSGNTTGYFVIDTNGTIATGDYGSGTVCGMGQPTMTFVTVTQSSTS